jgi:hypothetical protein
MVKELEVTLHESPFADDYITHRPVERGFVFCTFTAEYIHHWIGATDEEMMAKEVWFLRHPHRHLLHFKLTVDVRYHDREVEFISMKRWAEAKFDALKNGEFESSDVSIMASNPFVGASFRDIQAGTASMESIAYGIGQLLLQKYGNRRIRVEVSEDGENGGGYQWLPE